ncbi:pyruvate dehydrogenase complex dihydrolipoyllysine-residue acetyltransferase [Alteromonas ponticola]|uniref:Acetyltransferase component of pyruvate dehydrogenase complex n=1 Tax=Alteromonas aquimaris TaxID=2998417 RepID=A0ABT3P2U6_9ALTE|nr:pyruvate dehydrogenase complex dihydrolipoyllysine-residue acetyltransferase [Alteromonas aquimaris]MCW8107089.1 pyruvate dehydrogenase complex dihydrolipoyllysine-residue acetyltransferase [Alteromonas aquimaris]
MANIKEVRVPDLGEEGVEVIELCVNAGDDVEQEGALVTVESDKASMDIPAPFAGKLKELCVKVGDKISEGDLLAKIAVSEDADEGASDADKAAEQPENDTTERTEQTEDKPAQEKAAAKSPSSGGTVEVKVPDIGDASDVEIIEILVAEGDSVAAEDGLITLETDKATMDVPAPQAGKIKELKVKVGDKVSEGSLILMLESEGDSDDAAEGEQSAPSQAEASETDSSDSSASSGAEKEIEVTVPDIGDASDVDIIEVLVAEGDTINAEDGLITLETDKATMDVPAPQAGTVTKLMVKQGDKVSQGSAILMLKVAGGDTTPTTDKPQPTPDKAEPAQDAGRPKPPPVPHHPSAGEKPKTGKVHASPSVRRLAREFGVDLTQVSGNGPKNRILKEDVQSYVKYELSRPKATAGAVAQGEGGLQVIAPPKVDFSKFGEVEEKPLTRIQKISGPNLHRNWVTIPHVTQFEEADITDLEAFRKDQNAVAEKRKLGIKITPLVFMMKAVADALKAYPVFNTSLSADGESLIQKKYYHIGIAVDTPGGLVVPVVRDVDQKGIHELSKELMEISIKARDGKLKAADMQGSCFTISSLGGIGGTAFTPIVNAPDVAILGVSKSDMKPKWNGKEFEPRLMLPLSLSYDHRVIDGAVAARFAVHLKQVLEDLRQILL